MAKKRDTDAGRPKDARVFDRAEHEWYVDPPSVSAALFDVEPFEGWITDPCAGMGNIVRMAARAGHRARGSDIAPRPEHFLTMPFALTHEPTDFFGHDFWKIPHENIVSNPPYGPPLRKWAYRQEEEFILRALHIATKKVAVVLRLGWMAPRIDWLRKNGCTRILVLSPRPSMLPGQNIVAGETPGGGAVDYAWYIFQRGRVMAPTLHVAQRNPALDKPEQWVWRLGKR